MYCLKYINLIYPRLLIALLAASMLLVSGCTSLTGPEPGEPEYRSVAPPPAPSAASRNGAIYQAGHELVLFEDVKARRVGDMLTVLLRERTDAEKSANTEISKESNNGVELQSSGLSDGSGISNLLNIGGIFDQDRSFSLGHSSEFEGEGDSDQSNRLEGQITVTVSNVLPNGNLEIQGEKWILINQGKEYIRLRGIVRPEDIGPDNTVLSNRIANAHIGYSGKGTIQDSNIPGWLAKFFMSAIFLL